MKTHGEEIIAWAPIQRATPRPIEFNQAHPSRLRIRRRRRPLRSNRRNTILHRINNSRRHPSHALPRARLLPQIRLRRRHERREVQVGVHDFVGNGRLPLRRGVRVDVAEQRRGFEEMGALVGGHGCGVHS